MSPREAAHKYPHALRGYLFVLSAATFWATLGPLYIFAMRWDGVTPLTIIIYRTAFAGLALGFVLALGAPRQLLVQRRHWPYFVAYGLFGVATFYVAYIYAVLRVGVAVAVVLMYTAPGWVAVIAFFWLGESLDRWHLAALFSMLVGIILISRAYTFDFIALDWLGILLALASGLLYAIYSVFQKVGTRYYSPWTVQFYGFSIGLLPLLFLQPLVQSMVPLYHFSLLLLLLFLGIVTTLGGGLFFAFGVQWVPVSRASILASLEPVIATFLGVLLFHEQLLPLQWIGGALVVFAALLLRGSAGQKTQRDNG